ncbi:MAG: methyltransferase domain-containing protein [Spirochaetales bacterium]|nr:methyltransferase domain-containing protein [Spirochaetales bacterium]
MSLEYWNKIYTATDKIRQHDAGWMDSYARLFSEAPHKPVIDLGCGPGAESLYLLDRGYQVISCDFSPAVLEKLAAFDSRIVTRRFDLKDGLPFADGEAHVILASLCLHYFSSRDTVFILSEINRVLDRNGCLICRLNSVNDFQHGAGQGIEIEKNYYDQQGNCKRFFDPEDLDRFFAGWEIKAKRECDIDRFENTKKAWEVAARKLS